MIEPPIRDWAYGVTTVPQRRKTYLPRTLRSLEAAGFDRPHLFVDGEKDAVEWRREFDLEVTAHHPRLHATGNWIVALWTLYLHYPMAQRFALFQDDIVAVRNLRAYLESADFPQQCYYNLYTAEDNEAVVAGKHGWVRSKLLGQDGNDRWQVGRGALGIVLPVEGVIALLSAKGTACKPLEYELAHHKLDGMIVNAMNQQGWSELVHSPSLVQHVGQEGNTLGAINPASTMGRHSIRRTAQTFPGEDFDARKLLT